MRSRSHRAKASKRLSNMQQAQPVRRLDESATSVDDGDAFAFQSWAPPETSIAALATLSSKTFTSAIDSGICIAALLTRIIPKVANVRPDVFFSRSNLQS